MNSLVVLLSLVALAAAKPSTLHSEVIAYAAPAVAAIPAAVSSQSRIDIKSSPAYISTAAVAPIARTVIAEPAIVATPAIAPAAVSHQSRIDIKSSPAVVSSVVSPAIATYAAPLVKTAVAAPVAYAAPAAIAAPVTYSAPAAIAAPVAYSAPAAIAAPVAYSASAAIAAPVSYAAPAVAAPIAYAAAAPAQIALPSVPLDTPEVAAARAAHFEAKAIAEANAHGAHFIHKRSAPLIAAPAFSYAASPIVSTYAAPLAYHAPLAYRAPLTYHAPLVAKAYSVHPW